VTGPTTPAVELRGIRKAFDGGRLRVLDGIDFTVPARGTLALVGASGSGKTTLLNVLGLLDDPDEGDVLVDGRVVADLDRSAVTRLRAERFGFVFQDSLVDPRRTALENVTLALGFAGIARADRTASASDALHATGVADRAHVQAGDLSGGERQRVAVARAIAHRPPVLLCDEPTGNLDHDNTERVFALLRRYAEADGSVVVVTHDLELAARCDRSLRVLDGALHEVASAVEPVP
jgi:putative ABC transport system ATP-binding protein